MNFYSIIDAKMKIVGDVIHFDDNYVVVKLENTPPTTLENNELFIEFKTKLNEMGFKLIKDCLYCDDYSSDEE